MTQESTSNIEFDSQGKTPNKIIVQVWLLRYGKGRDRLVAQKKVPMGTEYVEITPKGFGLFIHRKSDKRRYQINYQDLKETPKGYLYMTDVTNTLGALSFGEYPKHVDSRREQKLIVDNNVRMYVEKGGIPLLYLLIAMMGMVVGMGVSAFFGIQYFQIQDMNTQLDTLVTNLKAENAILRSQIP